MKCKQLLMLRAKRTHAHNCTAFCATGSLECLGAWEELGGGCKAGGELSCDSPRPEVSALICECRPVPATTTTTTTASPLGSTIGNTGPNGICLQVPAVGLADLEVQTYVCMYVYMCICRYVYISIYLSLSLSLSLYIYIYIYLEREIHVYKEANRKQPTTTTTTTTTQAEEL